MLVQQFKHENLIFTIEMIDSKLPLVITTKKNESAPKTDEKKTFVFKGPIKKGENLSGLQIEKVIIDNKQFEPKANRFLLKLVLNYIVKENKINLLFDMPYKASEKTKRCLINNCQFHPDNKKMSDILPLIDGNDGYFIDTKGSTNSLHNLCYELLKKHQIPFDVLEIHYTNRKVK